MALLWDLLFLTSVGASCVFLYRRTRSLNMTLIMFVSSISFVGIFGQILEVVKISTDGDQIKVMICVLLLAAAIFTNNATCFRSKALGSPNASVFVFSVFVFIFGTAAITRVFAKDQMQDTLTQFSYLISEDNGAWLDISKKLVSGDSIPYEAIGGPLIALLVVCQSVASLLVYILTGKRNELAIVLNSVVIAYLILPLFAAIAFSQIAERLVGVKRLASLIITSCFWFPVYGSMLIAQYFGHLSFIYVTSVYTCCIWAIANKESNTFWEQKIAHLCLIATMPVWLPLNVLTVVLIVIFCTQVGKQIIAGSTLREKCNVVVFFGVPIIAVTYILKTSFSYSASSITQIKGLISASGGTGSASHVFLVILVIAMLYTSLSKTRENQFNPTSILKIGIGYVLIVIFVDYWLTNQMNYGSTKLLFAASIVATPIAAFNAFESILQRRDAVLMSSFASVLFVAVCLIGLIDSWSVAVLGSVSPLRWPPVDKSVETSWRNAILITRDSKNLEDLQIGCINRNDSGSLSVDLETYNCTRALLSIGGIWSSGNQLAEFQLWPDKERAVNLQSIDSSLLGKELLILDVVEHKVISSITLSEFIDYLKAHPPLE